jgi:segregation and condensation protein A
MPENSPLPPVPEQAPESSFSIQLSSKVSTVSIKEIVHPDDQRATYQITLPAFDGPMDLLLHLIKEHELDIYDIPISRITNEYLAYIELLKALNLEIAGDFLVMAATLMQIKSRMLLPLDSTPEEPEEDPRLELMRRLLEYKKFRDAAEQLMDLEKNRRHLLPRGVSADQKEGEEEERLEEVTLFGLLAAYKDILIHSQEDVTAELTRPEITVSQKINDLMDVLQENPRVVFRPFLESCRTKTEKIVALLALLELIRLKLVRVVQNKVFGEIEVILVQPESPAPTVENT